MRGACVWLVATLVSAPAGAGSEELARESAPFAEAMRLLHDEDNTRENLEASLRAFDEALAAAPSRRARALAHAFQGLAYLRLGTLERDATRRRRLYERAIEEARTAVSIDDSSAEAWFYYGATMGVWARDKGPLRALAHVDDVRRAFEEALERDPGHHGATLALGVIEKQVPPAMGGNRARAERRFRSVLAQDPHFTRAMIDLAELLFEDGRVDEAMGWARKARDESAPTHRGEWRKLDRPRAMALLERAAAA